MTSSPLLYLDRVSRRYGGLTALHELTLQVPAGARHAIIGANGAGKTTAFHLIAGTVRPSGGRIILAGHDLTRLGPAARARRGVGRTFQHPAVVERLSTAANIALAITRHTPGTARRRLLTPNARTAQVDAALAAGNLTTHATTTAGHLSYGLRRRLELAVALAAAPRLLLLDEPSAGLDPDEITHLTATIRALPAAITVVLIDHHLDLVWNIADTVTVLHHGRHVATGPTTAVRADPAVHAAYLTPPTVAPQSAHTATPTRTDRHSPTDDGAQKPLLRIRALQTGYHGAPVLHDVNLDLPTGAAVAILGRNGAGKTTLLSTVAGLLPRHPASQIDLDDRPLPTQPAPAARAGVALVPQGRHLFDLTVEEHLTVAYATRRRAPGPCWNRDHVLALLPPLARRLRHHAAQLSGGEQQMLALARALLGNPRLLLLDEPTEGLAPAVVDQLATAIRLIGAEQVTVLLAEQHLPFALAVAGRAIVLDRGRCVLDTPITILDDTDIRRQVYQALGVAATGTTP